MSDPWPSADPDSLRHVLASGGPTVYALARLAARRWTGLDDGSPDEDVKLSREAQAILATARGTGMIELKATNIEVDSAERMLTVHVEKTTHE